MKIVLKGKVVKLTMDEKFKTGKVVAVVHVEDPFYSAHFKDASSASSISEVWKKILVPGEELRIGEEVVVTVTRKEDSI